jgi:hypothetical protein
MSDIVHSKKSRVRSDPERVQADPESGSRHSGSDFPDPEKGQIWPRIPGQIGPGMEQLWFHEYQWVRFDPEMGYNLSDPAQGKMWPGKGFKNNWPGARVSFLTRNFLECNSTFAFVLCFPTKSYTALETKSNIWPVMAKRGFHSKSPFSKQCWKPKYR